MRQLAVAVRIARREMRGGLKGFRVFLVCLALGVAAIAGVGSLAASVRAGLEADARLILGGDVELSFTHVEASAEQYAHLRSSGEVSEIAEMRAMARAGDRRALVELKAVDGAYPLIGAVTLEGEGDLRRALARTAAGWGAAAERSTLDRLGLSLGDRVQVGDETFTLRAVVVREPDRTTNVFTLGPRLMIARESLPATGLVQPGSLIRWQYRVALPEGTDAQGWIEATRQRFPDAAWRIRSISEAGIGVQRWVERIALLLSLVGLTALLVGGVGVANAVKSYLEGKVETIATLKCIGATGRVVMIVYLLQVLALAGMGIAVGLAIGAAVPAVLGPLLSEYLPVPPRLGFYPLPLLLAAAFGAFTALAFSLWPLARARDIRPGALFRELVAPERRLPRAPYLIATGASVLALAVLAVATSVDRRLAMWFVAIALATFALFRVWAWVVAWLARRAPRARRPALRLALANIHRPGSPTPGIVLSLGLGLTVLVLVSLVQSNLVRQLRDQIPEIAPTFFFIDIQPDQVEGFDQIMRTSPGVGHTQKVPSLRGRIVKLNGVPVERAVIAQDAQWATGGDRGLTYAATPPSGARIVAGDWWPADYSGPPLISLDARIAAGFGLGIGDTITINVLGIEVEARIANLRAIDWTSLGINFTLIFAPGTLESAPQTWIATAQVAPGSEDAVERAVTARYPNISTIRVRDALATMEHALSSIAMAARATAGLALVAGILVLAGAVFATHRRRVYDAVVLKVLGARRRNVLIAFLIEFGLVGAATSVIAAVIGTACAWAFTLYLRLEFTFLPGVVAGVAVLATLAIVTLGLAGTWRALAQKPAPLLRNA